jgi:hypothetical protein
MKPEDDEVGPRFECRKVEVHYIYSFALGKVVAGSDGIRPASLPFEPSTIAERDSGKKGDPSEISRLKVGGAPHRFGIAPHLAVKQDVAWGEFADLPGAVNGHAITVARLLRLFPIGGTACLTIRLNSPDGDHIGVETIKGLLSLTDQRSDIASSAPRLTIHGDRAGVSLYGLFERTVKELCSAVEAQWLDFDAEPSILERPSEARSEVQSDSQGPWVVTIAEVDGRVKDAFCSSKGSGSRRLREKLDRMRPYERQIAPILFRSVSKQFDLEPAYVDPMTPGGLPGLSNLNLDARFYVQMSRRSVFCVTSDLKKDPAKYFIPGLLDICETVRANWHMLVVMNRMLDDILDFLREDKAELSERLSGVIRIREWVAKSLDDPGVYIVAGDALAGIYERLQGTFRIADLRSLLFRKVDLLERMYKDRFELEFLEARSR